MLIEKVMLDTRPLKDMKHFYEEVLGFKERESEENQLTIEAGRSTITFQKVEEGNPFYHFAFDIPADQFQVAKEWVKARTPLLKEEDQDEVAFEHLQACAFYFQDPAGNIVECIARRTAPQSDGQPFSIESLQKVSEMSFVAVDAGQGGEVLERLNLIEREKRPIRPHLLNFMGEKEDESFLLLLEPGRKWLFSDQMAEVYPVTAVLKGRGTAYVGEGGLVSVEEWEGGV
ncbi:glyoxalase [Halobacillus kuroshimensis]|uniref:Glyoxalase n=1 Tax=Halobacillus kuroshimensis TaxID=302481 RepID=A0ABS3DRB5_9BACI|nr:MULTISPECIES: VOC family protein [Halobacillus]MBN8233880.1 glyoxalase [Halobacillus kuroshimensis]